MKKYIYIQILSKNFLIPYRLDLRLIRLKRNIRIYGLYGWVYLYYYYFNISVLEPNFNYFPSVVGAVYTFITTTEYGQYSYLQVQLILCHLMFVPLGILHDPSTFLSYILSCNILYAILVNALPPSTFQEVPSILRSTSNPFLLRLTQSHLDLLLMSYIQCDFITIYLSIYLSNVYSIGKSYKQSCTICSRKLFVYTQFPYCSYLYMIIFFPFILKPNQLLDFKRHTMT